MAHRHPGRPGRTLGLAPQARSVQPLRGSGFVPVHQPAVGVPGYTMTPQCAPDLAPSPPSAGERVGVRGQRPRHSENLGLHRGRSVGVPPLRFLALLVLLLAACGPPEPVEPLWAHEAAWTRTEHGRVHAVPLDGRRTLELEPGETRHFRTVAVPGASAAGLTLTTQDGFQVTHLLNGPTPIDIDLAGARTLELTPGGPLHLLRPRLSPPGRRGRRMLLVVADTLRHDHATAEHMPRLEQWFRDGLRFEHAYSPASWTLPAVASLFTGQRPTRLRAPDGTLIALGAGAPTLARRLGERGWATAAVVANVTVNHENGFSQGFDVFDVPSPGGVGHPSGEIGEAPDIRWLVERAREIKGWWDDEDLFLYLQPMDAHDPYRPHDGGDPLPAPHSGETLDRAALETLRSAYAAEVEHLDHHLGELLETLGEIDTAVFTADHGEELFDHGGFRHGPTLYDEVVEVPLWIRGHGIAAGSTERPVSTSSLGGFLLARAQNENQRALDALDPDMVPVTVETFTFGPPRFSALVGHRRPILFSRPVEPESPTHPIEAWLRQTQPAVQVVDAHSPPSGPATPTPPAMDEALARQTLRQLIDQYRGFRQGLHLHLEPGSTWHLRLEGIAADGWFWGEGRVEARRQPSAAPGQAAALELDLEAAEPFLLLFLPRAEGVDIAIEDLDQSETLDPEHPIDRPGLRLWYDRGRPPEALAGQAVTLERLRALGYL